MISKKPDRRVVQSRGAIREALLELLGHHKLSDITAAMIAEQANVGYATFFRHYPDAEAVLLEVSETMIADVSTAVLPALLSRDVKAAMHIITEHVAANRELAYAMLVSAGPVTQQTMINHAVTQNIIQSPTPEGGIPRELAARFTVSAMIAVLAWWLEKEPHQKHDIIAGHLQKLVAEPLLT